MLFCVEFPSQVSSWVSRKSCLSTKPAQTGALSAVVEELIKVEKRGLPSHMSTSPHAYGDLFSSTNASPSCAPRFYSALCTFCSALRNSATLLNSASTTTVLWAPWFWLRRRRFAVRSVISPPIRGSGETRGKIGRLWQLSKPWVCIMIHLARCEKSRAVYSELKKISCSL